jgi:PAS domain S-box-containing protein
MVMVVPENFQYVFNLIEDAVFVYPLDSNSLPEKYICVNDWVCEKYGYSRDEFMTLTPMQINDKDAAEKYYFPALKELKNKKTISFESIHTTKLGKRIHVEGHMRMINLEGKPVVVSIVRDITEHKRAEQQLRDYGEKFVAVFHASTDLMAITRHIDGKILEVNEGYSQMLGYSRDESIGKTTTALNIWVNPSDRTTFVEQLKKNGEVKDFETTLRRKDGSLIIVLDSARIFKYQGEECILSVSHDITARKNTENNLKNSKEALQTKIDEMEKFNKLTINREVKMVDLKNRIKELEALIQQKN